MTIQLRPHHLLCLMTYAGRGYSPAFTANFDGVARRVSQGEAILIVDGPDDICAPLLGEGAPHCWRESVTERDRLAARDAGAVMACAIQAGSHLVLSPLLLGRLRTAFSSGENRTACAGCEWFELCSFMAQSRYRGTRL